MKFRLFLTLLLFGFVQACAAVCVNETPTAATLIHGWVHAGVNDPYAPIAYYRDANCVVHIQGAMQSGETNSALILPPGYRPAGGQFFVIGASGGYAEAYVHTDGQVFVSKPGDPSGWNSLVTLSGISFLAAP